MKAFFALLAFAISVPAFASDWSQLKKLHGRQLERALAPYVASSADPVYQQIFNEVDQAKILSVWQQATGSTAVTVKGNTFNISNRYTPADKANWRQFFMQYFTSLGIPVQELAYPTQHQIGETQGHNVEAVLAGKSADSIVIIVHYDSIGPDGDEANNPGVDDDMSGMVTAMETARVLAAHKGQLQHTVRFVAADYEEQENPGLEGARAYAKYIQALSQQQGFKILAAIDNEQSGWNCAKDGTCDAPSASQLTMDVFSCSGDSQNYDSQALGDALEAATTTYSTQLTVNRGCIADNSDHYAMWEIGVPAVVFSEHNPFDNPHFDAEGGDTFDNIDQDYHFHIAQVGVTFAAMQAGLDPQ